MREKKRKGGGEGGRPDVWTGRGGSEATSSDRRERDGSVARPSFLAVLLFV